MRPPLRQQVDLGADAQAFTKPNEGLLHERAVPPLEREQERRERAEEAVGEREIDTVEQEGRSPVGLLTCCLCLIPLPLEGGGDGSVAAAALQSIIKNSRLQSAQVPEHKLGKCTLDQREIVIGLDDSEQRVGPGREVGEMVSGRGHDEVEVAVALAARAFGYDCFQSGSRLFEGEPGTSVIAPEFAEA